MTDAATSSPALSAPEPVLSAAARRIVPWLCGTALFMELLDATIVNAAVPTMATALRVPPLSLKTVLTSYTIVLMPRLPSPPFDTWIVASAVSPR